MIENGDVLEFDGERAAVIDKREIGRTFIDETGFEEIDSETVRQRKQLAYEGAVTVVVSIDEETGEILDEPQIVSRGVRGLTTTNGFSASAANLALTSPVGSNYLISDAQRTITASIAGASQQTLAYDSLLKEHLRFELKRFFKSARAQSQSLPL